MVTQQVTDNLAVPDAPAIPGLSFRRFRGESDYAVMVDIHQASDKADDCDTVYSRQDAAFEVEHLVNFDPYQDILFVEINSLAIGYCLSNWVREPGDMGVYYCQGYLAPEWRRRGIGCAMLHWCESRLSHIAAEEPVSGHQVFRCVIAETRRGSIALLENEGYAPAAYFARMLRPDLEGIPDAPMPEGLEVHPVLPAHHPIIWEAEVEAFMDHWGFSREEFTYEMFQAEPNADPTLWRVAWDGDQVAGMVRSYINQQENAEFNRERGWTEDIGVRRPWRRRGLARALLCRSLHVLKNRGMSEAGLHVHTENLNRAFQLYESVGFHVDKMFTIYQKPVQQSSHECCPESR